MIIKQKLQMEYVCVLNGGEKFYPAQLPQNDFVKDASM